ncbi:unnamed protein product [Rotaria sordida]|uniref:Uncharacterized protein n=1 Tax=Rotaria sordida TaxID=392033 RepID=A0A814Q968_9BILA|nr:unnamed protein product [Rotaria sordida]
MIPLYIKTQLNILYLYLKDLQPNRNHDKKRRNKQINKYDIKLQSLINKRNLSKSNYNLISKDTSNVLNKSSVHLPERYLNVLAKGLKFIPTPTSFYVVDMIANIEKALQSTPSNIKKSIISEMSTFMLKWKKPNNNNMTKEEHNMLAE